MTDTRSNLVREAVGVFHDEKDLEAAIDDLLMHGFDRSELSLLASEETVEQRLGHWVQSNESVEDDPEAPRIPYIARESVGDAKGIAIGGLLYIGALAGIIPVVASGGAIPAIIAGGAIGGGAGAAIGSVLAAIIGEQRAKYIDEQLRHGGLVLWVRTWTPGDETRAVDTLKKHGGLEVHVHGLQDEDVAIPEAYFEADTDSERDRILEALISPRGDGGFEALGRAFALRDEARTFLTRRAAQLTFERDPEMQEFDIREAYAAPGRVFESPEDLLETPLPSEVKCDLLKRWAYDESQRELATGEGMAGSADPELLRKIENAILNLDASSAGR